MLGFWLCLGVSVAFSVKVRFQFRIWTRFRVKGSVELVLRN